MRLLRWNITRGWFTKFNCMLWLAGSRNEPVEYGLIVMAGAVADDV
jgi:hypothetical protein